MELNLERREASAPSCPLCRADVLASERVVCTCGVEYHPACLAELRACVTIGCEAAPPVGVTARRGVCCRCGEPVRTRPAACDDCGERHHAWCRTRACGEHERAQAAVPRPPVPAAWRLTPRSADRRRDREPRGRVERPGREPSLSLTLGGLGLLALLVLSLVDLASGAIATPDQIAGWIRLNAVAMGVVVVLSALGLAAERSRSWRERRRSRASERRDRSAGRRPV